MPHSQAHVDRAAVDREFWNLVFDNGYCSGGRFLRVTTYTLDYEDGARDTLRIITERML